MEVAVVIIAYAVAFLISTAVLAGSLFLVEDIKASSFKEFGAIATLGRCAGIVLANTLLALIPYGGLLALVVWFVGIMFLFQKSFGQTFILFLINVAFMFAVTGALRYLL